MTEQELRDAGVLLPLPKVRMAWAAGACFLLALLLAAFTGTTCPLESSSVSCNDGDVTNGYWAWGFWVPALVSEETWMRAAPAYSYGRLVWYAPGPMEATAAYRGLSLDGFVDGVALMSPADIGQTVWLRRPGHGWEGPFLVVDCAQRDDIYWIVRWRKEVVEVGWRTHELWGLDRPLDGVEVVKAPDAWQLWRVLETQSPVDYREWFLAGVEWE